MDVILAIMLGLVLIVLVVLLYLVKSGPKGGGLGQDVQYQELRMQLAAFESAQVRLEQTVREEMARGRQEAQMVGQQGREESLKSVTVLGDSLLMRTSEVATMQKNQLDIFAKQLQELTASNVAGNDKMRDTLSERLDAFTKQLQEMTASNVAGMDKIKEALHERLQLMQTDNATKLEQMRVTVDEKLQSTLEKRLGESFKLVSERLEQVQKGLGEMQNLATGVGDLKRVLTNVKTRGTFGEVQLGALLEQILAPGQYDENVETRVGSGQRVEYALRLPGIDGEPESVVYLPIDAKFPQEDYLRLLDAQENTDVMGVKEARKALERAVRLSAKDIRDKYLDPPQTTDFGVIFLPTEGLYAEVLRMPGLFEALQSEFKVIPAGPSTLAALLNALQMGFRTLAIEKRSAEVWELLGAVRTEFGLFGGLLDKTEKKLQEASNHIKSAGVRTRAMERKLRDVQSLPEGEAKTLLGIEGLLDVDAEE